MQPDQTRENKKRAYEKPRLRTIELAAEEVLAVGCKLAFGGGGPEPPTCATLPCVGDGS